MYPQRTIPNVFEAIAYVGVGPLRFGMGAADVTALFGKPPYVTTTQQGTPLLDYLGLRLFFSADDRLVECAFTPPVKLLVGGIDVLNDKLALNKLAKLDASALRHEDTVLFLSLGLSMGVNQSADHEAVVFRQGEFDELLRLFKPYHIVRSV